MELLSTVERDLRLPPNHSEGRDTTKIHISEILAKTAVSLGHLSPQTGEDDEFGLMVMGLAWEDMLAQQVALEDPSFIYHPGEFERDDILGSPDGLSSYPGDPNRFVIREFKSTKKSSNHHPIREADGKWWMWLRQGMCYCAVVPNCEPEVWWTVLHINRDYKWESAQPLCLDYRIRFTEEEIEQNWKFMLANR
jgi:hypothetical protein